MYVIVTKSQITNSDPKTSNPHTGITKHKQEKNCIYVANGIKDQDQMITGKVL